jgi:hypothetical protein
MLQLGSLKDAAAIEAAVGGGAVLGDSVRLPPLLEVEIQTTARGKTPSGEAHSVNVKVSVFAPLLRSDSNSHNRALLAGWHPAPPIHLADTLIELFGARPRFVCEPLTDRTGFRMFPLSRRAVFPDSGMKLTLHCAGETIDPVPEAFIDRSMPGQLVVRLPPDRLPKEGRHWLIQVAGPSLSERHHGFLPACSDEYRLSGKRPAVPLRPSEATTPFPPPEEVCIDSLTLGTIPAHTLDRVWRPTAQAENWTAAHRGVVVTPLTGDQESHLRDFAGDTVRLRSSTESARGWFLAGLFLLAAGCLSRWWRRPFPGQKHSARGLPT